jgi:hypothetical protein
MRAITYFCFDHCPTVKKTLVDAGLGKQHGKSSSDPQKDRSFYIQFSVGSIVSATDPR